MSHVWWFVLTMVACVPLVAAENDKFPGQKQHGFLFPNGWTITPAGEQVPLKDLPLNIVPLSDGRHALVATSGYNAHELTLIDLKSKDIKQTADRAAELVRPGAYRPTKTNCGGAVAAAARCTCSISRTASLPVRTMAIQPQTPVAMRLARTRFVAASRSTADATCSIRSISTPDN